MANAFQKQLEALGTALLLIERLPPGTIWSICCTNEDDTDQSALNIYAPEREWARLILALKLKGDSQLVPGVFQAFRRGTLTVTFTKE